MNDRSIPPEVYERWRDTKDRTARWIDRHKADKVEFYSPSRVPTMLFDPDFELGPPSDAESSHSLPPKMVLRWGDGRPDEKIRPEGFNGHKEPRTRRKSRQENRPPSQPEQIRILPSLSGVQPPKSRTSHQTSHSHQRSRSMSTATASRPDVHVENKRSHRHTLIPQAHPLQSEERPIGPIRDNAYVIVEPTPPPVVFTQSQPAPYHTNSGKSVHSSHRSSHKQPPPMIYAPSSQAHRMDYAPQVMYGPDGVMYSHSASQAQPYHASYRVTPSPGPESRPHKGERRRAQSMKSSHQTESRRSRPRTESVNESDPHKGAYYVLPSHGQKVHVITPDHPDLVQTTPSSNRGSSKRPFLQRLFNMKIRSTDSSSAKSSSDNKRTHRSHSVTGSSHRQELASAH